MAASLHPTASRALGLIAIALAVLAASCIANAGSGPKSTPTPAVPPTAVPTPPPEQRYQRLACRIDVPLNRHTECGYLTVPENRNDPNSRNIMLAVVVAKSDNPRPLPDPIIYLDGGPGGSTLETAYLSFDAWFGPFALDRDVILFDQRGIGKSRPALDCATFNNAFRQSVERDTRGEQLRNLVIGAFTACHQDLVAQGVNLSGYTSAESAADLDELRRALGYDEWNLYGISYGTRLALTTMRDYPRGTRSVILDSSYPPEVDLYADLVPNAQRAFDALFAGCAADPACGSAYPDLESVFYGLVDQLNAEPAALEVKNEGTGRIIQAKMSGDLLLRSMFQALYDAGSIPYLPAVIYAAHDGDFGVLKPLLGDLFFTFDTISAGMHYSVQCAEEVPFGSAEAFEAAAAAHPKIRAGFDSEPIYDICLQWDVEPADPKENQPIVSDIPTLVLSGEYDPITPPSWGEQVAHGLSRSYYFSFPGVGHGASVSDICPLEIVLAFLDDPAFAPDGSCVASMSGPDFLIDPF